MNNLYSKIISNLTLVLAIFLWGCDSPKIPSFERLESLKVEQIEAVTYRISAEAVYNNPNPFGGQLVRTDMDVFIDNQLITSIEQDEEVEVIKNSEFRIPIIFKLNPVDLVNNKDGILKSLIEQIKQHEVNVHYKGFVTVKMMSAEINVPMDYTETIELTDINVGAN